MKVHGKTSPLPDVEPFDSDPESQASSFSNPGRSPLLTPKSRSPKASTKLIPTSSNRNGNTNSHSAHREGHFGLNGRRSTTDRSRGDGREDRKPSTNFFSHYSSRLPTDSLSFSAESFPASSTSMPSTVSDFIGGRTLSTSNSPCLSNGHYLALGATSYNHAPTLHHPVSHITSNIHPHHPFFTHHPHLDSWYASPNTSMQSPTGLSVQSPPITSLSHLASISGTHHPPPTLLQYT